MSTPEEKSYGRFVIRQTLQYWIDYDKAQRDKEGLETTDDTHILTPPTWPSHGMLKAWITALNESET